MYDLTSFRAVMLFLAKVQSSKYMFSDSASENTAGNVMIGEVEEVSKFWNTHLDTLIVED